MLFPEYSLEQFSQVNSMKKRLFLFLLVFLLSGILFSREQKADGDWWIKSYGEIHWQEDMQVLQAQKIFNYLWNAMQPTTLEVPRLIVLPASSEKWLDSWAFSLADGSVILTRGILDLAFESEDAGDSRLAFILSHELAHLSNRDHDSVGQSVLFHSRLSEFSSRKISKIEFEADRYGLFLMTMAGYDPKEILRPDQESFLVEYAEKVRQRIRSIDHTETPLNEELKRRTHQLKQRLISFANELSFFKNGVQSYFKSDYKNAEKNFKQFKKAFEGREVLNNLSLSQYQLARQKTSGCAEDHLSFFLATELDLETRADKLRMKQIVIPDESRICKKDAEFRKLINQARMNLDSSVAKDPEYLPAQINRLALNIFVKNYQTAIREADRLYKQGIRNSKLMNNMAVALYLTATEANKDRAVRMLEKIPANSSVQTGMSVNLQLMGGGVHKSESEFHDIDPAAIQEILRKKSHK